MGVKLLWVYVTKWEELIIRCFWIYSESVFELAAWRKCLEIVVYRNMYMC